jgi:uncharacterized protein (TIGR04255 family)
MLMQIQKADRVLYQSNPLAEVVCQARVVRSSSFEDPTSALSRLHEVGFVEPFTPPATLNVNIGPPGGVTPSQTFVQAFGATTADGQWSVTFSAEAFALTCNQYTTWFEFLPRFLEVERVYAAAVGSPHVLRLGLRYKDVVDRERLGLEGQPWHTLIKPFLLGPLANGVFVDSEAIPESQVKGSLTHSVIELHNCMMILQSALLRSVEEPKHTVFLIDTDFFREFGEPTPLKQDQLATTLDELHENAGAMFRRGITEDLHAALSRKN